MKTLINFSFRNFFLMFMALYGLFGFAQTAEQIKKITSSYNFEVLNLLKNECMEKEKQDKLAVIAYALKHNLKTRIELNDGGVAELMQIDTDGTPIYYRTFNVDAARSTRTNYLHTGGSLGLNLMGLNMRTHVWDHGVARASHQEYFSPQGTRYSVGDGTSFLSDHSAHVTGTIMAMGVVPGAKGMAPQSRVTGYDWSNDLSEAITAASNGMLLSNHSYGLSPSGLGSNHFGGYLQRARDWDVLMRNAPYYLMVVSAGNGGQFVSPNPIMQGYDKLSGFSTAKNNLVVANAQDANVSANGELISVAIHPSSSIGPTDDLRIKPDLTGNGTELTSTYIVNNSSYGNLSGTSMASPNVAGTLVLLQEHYTNLNDEFMRAATLKGLVLHTADDAGPAGPDAIFGWGLLNAKRAAEAISLKNTATLIAEQTLSEGETITLQVVSDGVSPLVASISWTDLPGPILTDVNNTMARLVNDLDIRVSKDGVTSLPWRLTAANANGLGDNTKDPFERIDIANASGIYTITISHKGTLSGENQNFSLIVTGLAQNELCSVPSSLNVTSVVANNVSLSWDDVSNSTYQVQYRIDGTTDSMWTTINSSSNAVTLTGLIPLTNYQVRVRSICPNNLNSIFTSILNFSTADLQYCASNGLTTTSEFIVRVQFNTINTTSSAGTGGYSNFTNNSTTVYKGSTYGLTVTPTCPGTVSRVSYAAWIDYNFNGIFEANELVWSRSNTTATTVSGSITIPLTATNGPTRMRVSMKYGVLPPTPCETFYRGEVEDYTINIVADTQAPTVPINLIASTITEDKVTLNWTAATDNVNISGYNVYRNGVLLGTVPSNVANISGLSRNTTYQFYVRAKDAAGNLSPNSNVISATTLQYCLSSGQLQINEWLNRVQLGTINNTSGANGGYANFTNLSTNLSKGVTNTITIDSGRAVGTNYGLVFRAWIDYNHNGVFDSNELIYNRPSTTAISVNRNFIVPSDALTGPTRMRVSVQYGLSPPTCGTFLFGEVEDYTVNITNANSIASIEEQTEMNRTISVYPNPTDSHIFFTSSDQIEQIEIFNNLGQQVYNSKSKDQVDVSNFSNGLYIIKLTLNDKTTKSIKFHKK